MPIHWCNEYDAGKARRRKLAEEQVRAKFPNIIEGSSGWMRAVANRMRRV